MPRVANVYNVPAGTKATTLTTIASVPYNAFIDDLVADANAARPVLAGGTGGTTAVAGADNLSTTGANIASATTTDIGAATGVNITITGTTTITGFGTKTAGVKRWITFSGILTLTHNATSLILPTGANITTAVGDTCVALSLGSGNWRVVEYQRVGGVVFGNIIKGNDTSGDTAFFVNSRTQAFGTFPAPIVYLDREATSGTGFIGSIPFRAHNDLEAMITYVQLRAEVTSTANAAPLGKLRITAPDLTDFASFAKDQIILSGLVDLSNAGGGTAYGQIKFPAVQVPSANANTLDDYKETAAYGTLPTFSATGSSFSYALQTARATKIGDRVDVDVIMTLNTSGNTLAANTLTILNAIPVAAGTDVRFEVYWTNSTTSYIKMFGVIGAGSTTMNVRGLTAAGTTVDVNLLANGALHATNGTRLAFNGTYFV